jgi:ribonuclease HI
MGYGWLIRRNEVIIARGHGVFARGVEATSNVAEYLGLIEGLEAMIDLGVDRDEPVQISGDAKCIIDQMRGAASVNSPTMRPLYKQAHKLVQRFGNIIWTWTPRRNNRDADQLTRRAMRQVRIDEQHFQAAVRAIDPRFGDGKTNKKFLSVMDLRVYLAGC